MEAPNSVDSVGHIQCYCPALQLPRIAIQHGIGRELLFLIRKCSTQLDDKKEPTWHFPSALSPEAHAEWGLYKILEYMGLHEKPPMGNGHNRAKLHKDIEESHIAYNVNFVADLLSTFLSHRPDGLAFDKGKKTFVFLEFTRAMDKNEDWATKNEVEKDERYSTYLGFINHLCRRGKAAGKSHRQTSRRECEDPSTPTSL